MFVIMRVIGVCIDLIMLARYGPEPCTGPSFRAVLRADEVHDVDGKKTARGASKPPGVLLQ